MKNMTKIQKVIGLAAAFTLMIGLSACTPVNGAQYNTEKTQEFTMTMNDGTVVPCIKHTDFYGFTCNFDKAERVSVPKP